jgi:hypothetical protein
MSAHWLAFVLASAAFTAAGLATGWTGGLRYARRPHTRDCACDCYQDGRDDGREDMARELFEATQTHGGREDSVGSQIPARHAQDDEFWDEMLSNADLLSHDVPLPEPASFGAGQGHTPAIGPPLAGAPSDWFTAHAAAWEVEMAGIGETQWFARVAAQ